MEFEVGQFLTRWTVRLAVACYVLRLGLDAAECGNSRAKPVARWLWTAGCGMFLLHVVCAFHFYHSWSHRAALKHTAEQTAAVVGVEWGGGLYFNYLFMAIWMADLAAWWRGGDAYIERRKTYWTVQTIFAFMMFNATVVFGPLFWRWAAVVVAGGWLLLRVVRRQSGR